MAKSPDGKKVRAKRMADVQTVQNQKPHPSAAVQYKTFRLQDAAGREVTILLTPKEYDAMLTKSEHRVAKNPEDVPAVGFVRDLLD